MQKMTHWGEGTIILGMIFALPSALLIWALVEFILLISVNALII